MYKQVSRSFRSGFLVSLVQPFDHPLTRTARVLSLSILFGNAPVSGLF